MAGKFIPYQCKSAYLENIVLLMIFGIVGVMRHQTKNARSYSQKIVVESLF